MLEYVFLINDDNRDAPNVVARFGIYLNKLYCHEFNDLLIGILNDMDFK